MTDWELFEQARKGDENAWRALVKTHHASLLRLSALLTGSVDAAQDVVQETFLRSMRSVLRHRNGTLQTYLSTIAYRLALKELKRRQRFHPLSDANTSMPGPTPLDAAILDERHREIARILQDLPDNQREILVLRFYRGHSYEEIALITGVPLGTVKSRIYYAVKTCKEQLQKRGIR